jgi:glycosyltransferase involved in cell wall biosynthesis
MTNKKIAIFVIAYNAEKTLKWVIDRIPQDVKDKVAEIFVFDDHSPDRTYEVGLEHKAALKMDTLKIFRNEKNLRYGGNQKRGYNYAIKQGFDIVVMLHGDGQYAPEALATLLEPLEKGEADAVFGSRMMQRGALKGGMPMYKYLGNKFLTFLENFLLGMKLTEFHSGYRLYSTHALKKIPFNLNTNDFHFDTDIIVQFKEAGLKIVERPIPTYYGDEISHVNSLKYGLDVVKSVLQYRLSKLKLIKVPKFDMRNAEKDAPWAEVHSSS